MVLIHVGVEVDEAGLAMAWVQEYVGCTSHGRSREEAVRLVPDALRSFWSWLREHGEPDVPEDDEEIVISEVVTCRVGSRLVDGDSEGFFSFDQAPVVPSEFERALRFMAYARSDVVALAQDLGDGLHRVVGRSGRSVGATLGHLAFADLWYAQRVGRVLDGTWETYLLDRLRNISVDWLQHSFLEEGRGDMSFVTPDAWGGTGREETWTLAKALRRYVWHDLIHMRAMRRSLCGGEGKVRAYTTANDTPQNAPAHSRTMPEVIIEVRRLDGGTLRIPHAIEMAQVFFHLDQSANGQNSYDIYVATNGRPKDRIVEEDVAAINRTMAARSSHAYWRELITEDPLPWLAALAPSWRLLDLSDEAWSAVEARLAAAFEASFGRGRRLSVVTKVLHIKRPDLIPVCDALVLQQLGAAAGTEGDPAKAAAFIGHLRVESRRNLSGLRAIQDRLKSGGRAPSLLRIFEALIWQSHSEVWYSKLAPLVAEWLEPREGTARRSG